MWDFDMLLQQLDLAFTKIASITVPQDSSDTHKTIQDILQRFVIINKDIVTALQTLEAQHIADREDTRIRILDSVATRHNQSLQPPNDQLNPSAPDPKLSAIAVRTAPKDTDGETGSFAHAIPRGGTRRAGNGRGGGDAGAQGVGGL